MPIQTPYLGYQFGVFFLLPKFNFNGNFNKVSGLGFSSIPDTKREGGLAGYQHQMTGNGTFNDLVLSRGFTEDNALYTWCELTHNTLQVVPCNILVSLLDKRGFPMKNWLFFHAIPKSWSVSDLNAESDQIMTESATFTYQSFILI